MASERLHERIYRRLLRLFPEEFRGDFGAQMAEDFRDQRAEGQRRGSGGLWRLWLRTVADALHRAPAEHLDILRQDAGYARRVLARSPGFAVAVVITLAISVGAMTAVFTLADPMLFRPFPYPESHRLVALFGHAQGSAAVLHLPDFLGAQAAQGAFEAVASFEVAPIGGRLRGGREEPLGYQVTRRFFDVLRVRPVLGRTFVPEEYQLDSQSDAAILTFAFWQTAFGGRPDILTRTLDLEGPRPRRFRIVGVLPAEFVLPDTVNRAPDFFVGSDPALADQGNVRRLSWPIARLAPGVTTEEATRELQRVLTAVEQEFPQFERGRAAQVRRLRDRLFAPVTTPMLTLLGTTACVLLLASVNLAHLFMARLHARRRELGVRLALGASRWRLMRLLMMEAATLAFAGAVAALLFAQWSFDLIMARTPEFAHVYRLLPAHLDARVAAFAVVLVGLATLIFGVGPAVGASRLEMREGLLTGGTARPAGSSVMWSVTLLILQSAVAVTVLTTGVLLVRSFTRLAYQPLGFDPGAVRAVDIDLDDRADGQQRQEISRLYEHLRERLHVPVTLAGGWPALTLPGTLTRQDATREPGVAAYPAAGTFFRVLDLRLTAGRLYSDAEAFADAPVAVVDRRAAARLWGDLDPLGRAVVDSSGTARVVIGVVDTLRTDLRTQDATGTAFIPFGPRDRLELAIQDSNDAVSVGQLRSAVQDIAPGAIVSLRPLEPFERTLGQPRFLAALLGALASLTMALASVGVFGVVNHQAVRRTREMGIRIALGAEARSIRRLVLWRALLPTALGIALGVGVLLLWTPTLRSLLFGLGPNDGATFALSATLVFTTVFAASAWPAWRASRIDPLVSLRPD